MIRAEMRDRQQDRGELDVDAWLQGGFWEAPPGTYTEVLRLLPRIGEKHIQCRVVEQESENV